MGTPSCNENTGLCGSGDFCNACRCLPPTAQILTPHGAVDVQRLHVGDEVITLTADGRRTTAVALQVTATPLATAHTLVVVTLDDGRTIRASGLHPLADGRALEDLAGGDVVDGARVRSVTRVPFTWDATWDVLPSGESGVVVVDEVPLRSTLWSGAQGR